MKKMAEGRKSQIVLLDERRLDIIIQPKLHAYELLDLVASHFKLREKHYFGLGYIDDTNHFTWLQADKKVLDHEFPKKTGLLVLYFSIRFYVETIGLLRDSQTIELFYLNARQVIFKGPVECDSETVFELAANVLQATNGDYATDEETREELKKLPLIPTSTLRERPSITYCEDRVIADYEKITGTSRGLAIVNYMTIVENLPTYGIHFYEVKDKKDIPWWLGISPKGIAVYDRDDKKTPRKLFTWKNLENLYYRDRKFSIEVSGPKRDESGNQVSVSRRTFGASNVDVHAWFAATAPLTKSIWSMAVSQHQFYLDRKQSKSQLPTTRSMSEIAAELCRSTASLPGSLGSDLSRSPSSHSLPSLSNSRYDLTIEQSDSLKAEREMVKALKARKEALEEALAKKTEELKRLCFEEGQLTGVLPHDTPLLAPGEQVPTFRRRVGTAFSLTVKDDKENDTQLSSELSKLELEVELQGKITSAAHRLASDKTVSKYVRKQRRQSYTRASGKLKEMEKKLGDMRRQLGKPVTEDGHRRMKEDLQRTAGFTSICQASVPSPSPGDSTDDQRHRTALSPSHSSPQLSHGPAESFDGHNRGSNETCLAYPTSLVTGINNENSTMSSREALPGGTYRLDGSHDSGFSSANNMYNVNSQRTSHYESKDHLRSPVSSEPGVIFLPPPPPQQSQYGQDDGETLQRAYSQERGGGRDAGHQGEQHSHFRGNTNLHYGSLDRQHRNRTKEIYRDISPMRYADTYGGDKNSGSRQRYASGDHLGLSDVIRPSNVILEVPVQHENEGDTLSVTNCYSPRFQEGSGMYKDMDKTHIHVQQQAQPSLSDAHHTASQPTFHRIERSISPKGFPSPNSSSSLSQPIQHFPQHSSQQSSSPSPSSYGGDISAAIQPEFHQTTATSPSVSRTINIQRIDSSHSSSHPSSPTSLYPLSNSSSPRGPSTPTSHAPSSLVTMSNLQPHIEVTKPYEISDFYRYSEKLRRQRIIDQYQRQLIGNVEKLSRSSTPQSLESDGGHSSHSSSSSHQAPSAIHSHTPQLNALSNYSSILPHSSRGPMMQYGRSSSAPLASVGQKLHPSVHSPSISTTNTRQTPHYLQQQQPPHSHHQLGSSFPSSQAYHPSIHSVGDSSEDPITSSSSSSYSYKSQGGGPGNGHYAYQYSSRIQQIHTSTKHSVYQSPQPMTCKPVKTPPKPSHPSDSFLNK